ncbi:MAG: septal ring lytic transglycosylase RlpA family protein [Robiginitalea sp.]
MKLKDQRILLNSNVLSVITVFLVFCSCKNNPPPYQTGLASFYSDSFEGSLTANGEVFTNSKMTAAHRTLPFGTKVRVTNLNNGKAVVVRVTDRGPYVEGRILDVARVVATELEFVDDGLTEVRLDVLDEAGQILDPAGDRIE